MTAPLQPPVTTPAREQEATAAQAAFTAALMAIGVETLADSLALWEDVPAKSAATTAAGWLNRAVALVLARRGASRDLAVAYYRLVRALRTGRTIPDPQHPETTRVTLQELRTEFAQLVAQSSADHGEPAQPDAPAPTPATPSSPIPETSQADSGGDDEVIEVEPIEGLAELEDELAKEAEEQVRDLLINLGPVHQESLVSKIKDEPDAPAKQVNDARKDAHDQAGSRQASAAEHTALNGARGTLWSLADRDKRVYGWARVSRTGTPCGFCAMLISRGAVYKSQQSAMYDDGDLYHLNCHCYAELMWSQSQYDNDPRFALNRHYQTLWPTVTKGLSGNDALNAWRSFITRQNADQTTDHSDAVQATGT